MTFISEHIKKIVIVSLMSSLVFLGTFLTRVEISFFSGHMMIHLGNMFCLVAAVLFGPKCGALAGAIGMGLFDIISGRFIIYFPFMFVLKYTMGYVCGYIKIKNFKNLERNKLNILAIFSSLIINIIGSPLISFVIKIVFYKLNFYIALINIISSVVGVIINSALSGFLALILLRF
ncbi:MAG: ECF transporter S component [Oscillospiraceae bacterium]|nr:ECF transporter S component [Oscillospiraceae bacterium]